MFRNVPRGESILVSVRLTLSAPFVRVRCTLSSGLVLFVHYLELSTSCAKRRIVGRVYGVLRNGANHVSCMRGARHRVAR